MAHTITVEFDKASYAPGDTIRMTLTAHLDTLPGETHTVSGHAIIDGQRVSFTGSFTIDGRVPTVTSWIIEESTSGNPWVKVAADPDRVIFETVA